MNRRDLQKKALGLTGELLREKGHIAFVDVFMKLGYLDQQDYKAWRHRRVPYLEKAIKVNLAKINVVMKAIINNSRNGRLRESVTSYRSWGKGKKTQLRFSKTGDPAVEKAYATHFLLPSEAKREDTGAEHAPAADAAEERRSATSPEPSVETKEGDGT